MSTVGNPVNVIPESGPLQKGINNNYPLSKEIEKIPAKKTNGGNKTSEKAASEPETKVKDNKTNLGFVYDGEVKKAILRVVDEETKKVIFQVPPEEMIARMKEDLKKENDVVPPGIIVDKKV
ncbi:MAG TPA: flagellar protein FlaG [Candidatus Brocadiia bacterium]|nr:flagellar protein FlaG [Planctomycetota bacterium]MDO8092744.1 flagellar protein FlaG [Candidatus Brocadiales bacterium]